MVKPYREAQVADGLGIPVADWLAQRYVAEGATYRELCAEVQINVRTLMRWMAKYSIAPISPSEATRRHMARDPEFIKRLHKAAGSDKAVWGRAQYRETNAARIMSPREKMFLGLFFAVGLHPIPEMAVERYNIDFAFPESMLAVELDPCWHKSANKAPKDARKDARLSALGWSILRLDTRTSGEYNVRKVVDALTALASSHP